MIRIVIGINALFFVVGLQGMAQLRNSVLGNSGKTMNSYDIAQLEPMWQWMWYDKEHELEITLFYKDQKNGQQEVMGSLLCGEKIYNQLPAKIKQKLIKCKDNQYGFISSSNRDQLIEIANIQYDLIEQSYMLQKPRVINAQNPKKINIDSCYEMLSSLDMVLYTGNSLSYNIYSCADLKRLTDVNKDAFDCACHFIRNIKNILTKFTFSCVLAFILNPSDAHKAIKEIADYKRCPIFTENYDFFHERTGVMPLKEDGYSLRTIIQDTEWKLIDMMVCVGLEHDERGLIEWYKTNNPSGIILAINDVQPSYIDNDDYWLQGDIKKLIPTLAVELCKKRKH